MNCPVKVYPGELSSVGLTWWTVQRRVYPGGLSSEGFLPVDCPVQIYPGGSTGKVLSRRKSCFPMHTIYVNLILSWLSILGF